MPINPNDPRLQALQGQAPQGPAGPPRPGVTNPRPTTPMGGVRPPRPPGARPPGVMPPPGGGVQVPVDSGEDPNAIPKQLPGYKRGGTVKKKVVKKKAGGKISSSARDGVARKGKTKGKIC